MADLKKKDSKPIMDVAHPNKSAPSDTSKPVIVNNRPILKDPMMFAKETEEPTDEPTKITVKSSGKSLIQPLDSAKEEKEPETEKPDPKRTIAELAAEADAAKPQTENQPETEAPEEKPAEEKKPDDEKAEPGADGKSPAQTPKEAEEEAAAAKKHDQDMQALVDSKKYFLPINTVEQRKSKRFIALGIVLSLILALAWINVALDAGLIQLNGVKPLTHFFSN